MTKIILANSNDPAKEITQEIKKEVLSRPNLFQGRTETSISKAKYPEWDVIPPSQFINPRIKAK